MERVSAGAKRAFALPSSSVFLALDGAEPLPYKWQDPRQESKLQPAVGPEGSSTGSVVPSVTQHECLGLGHLLPFGGPPAPRGQIQSRPQRAPPAALLQRYGLRCPDRLRVRGNLGSCSTLSCGGLSHLGSLFCQLEGRSHSLHSAWEGFPCHSQGMVFLCLLPETGTGEEARDSSWRHGQGGGGRDRDTQKKT